MGLPLKAPPPAPAPFTWTGCYGGLQIGVASQTDGFAQNNNFGIIDVEGFGGANNGANGWGAVAGGQIGCNYQINQLVVGIEGDGLWSSITNTSGFNIVGVDGEGIQLRTRNQWDADIALRVGAAFDRLLVYGKGGVAWGGFNFRETLSFGGVSEEILNSGNITLPGALFGVGMEYAFFPNWTAKIEYNYIAYAQRQIPFTFTEGGTTSPVEFTEAFGATKQIIKVGINYKFW
ncbi:MAG TPA: outer membrane beta-barrel protein [Xanthobacteraceae bacterium]|nr:outer membrane beta-barrel protein [Xanthobacteraceae bacterium]